MGHAPIRSTVSIDARAAGAIDWFVPLRVGSRGGSSRSSRRALITVTRVIGAAGCGTGGRYQTSENVVRRWSWNAERARPVRPPRAGAVGRARAEGDHRKTRCLIRKRGRSLSPVPPALARSKWSV